MKKTGAKAGHCWVSVMLYLTLTVAYGFGAESLMFV